MMISWPFGKPSPEAHGLHLAEMHSPFAARTYALSSERGFADKETLTRAAVLSVSLVNEMFVHGTLDASRWPTVRTHLEAHLVNGIIKGTTLLYPKVKVEPITLANKLRNESLKTSNSIVAVTELIERVVASMGYEEGLARYMGALLTYLWPNASDDDKSASVQSFYEIYIPYFQLPFAKYLKKHFAMAC